MKHSSGTGNLQVLGKCVLHSERRLLEEALNAEISRCSELGYMSTLSGTEGHHHEPVVCTNQFRSYLCRCKVGGPETLHGVRSSEEYTLSQRKKFWEELIASFPVIWHRMHRI
jgi:hypothetical protein